MASPSNRLHWLPCSIAHDGPAPVNEYFHPEKTGTTSGDLIVEEATLRGRRLVGATYPLPEGYVAYVLPKGRNNQHRQEDSDFDPVHSLLGLPPPMKWKSSSSSGSSGSSGNNGASVATAPTSLTYWKLDEHPTPQDGQRRALDWVETARAVAAHVGREEVEEAMRMR